MGPLQSKNQFSWQKFSTQTITNLENLHISGKYMYLLLKRHIGKFEVEIQIYLDTWVNYPSRGEASCGDQDFLAL